MSKWKMVKLGELFDVGSSKRVFQSEWRDSGIPFYRAREIAKLANDGYVNNELYIDEKMYLEYSKKYGIPSEGDIMVTGVGTLGVCYIVKNTDKFYFKDGNILWFKKTTDVNSSYISWVFRTNYMKEQIQKHSSGTTVGTFTISTAKEITVPLPPLEEQKRIADILDKASSLIDLRKQQLEKMDLMIKSKFIDMFGDPITNPKGWEVKKISDVCEINPRKTELGTISDDLEVSFVPMAAVSEKGFISTNEIKKYSEVKTGFTYFHDGDVLFAKITPCMENGKGAIAINLKNEIGFGSTEFHVIRPLEDITNSEWIFNLLSFKWLRDDAEKNMTGSAGQRRVPASYFGRCEIAVPPISLQNQFAAFVEQVEKQKAVMQQSLEKMETNYKALMQEYFG